MSKREIPIDDSQENISSEEGKATGEQGDRGGDADRMATLESENARLRDHALRTMADFDNFRRRAQVEREQTVQYANERLLRALLPIIDDFQRSVEAGSQSGDFQSFFQGVTMINDKLARTLEAQGVKRIPTVGEPFNVELHEALMRQPSDAPEDTIISELEPGYTYGDRVLRHAKVIVSAGS